MKWLAYTLVLLAGAACGAIAAYVALYVYLVRKWTR